MRLKYDLNVGALYIRLTDRTVAQTRDLGDNTSVDLDDAGDVVGIEVISIVRPWALDDILREYKLPAAEVAQLRAYFQPTATGSPPQAPALSIERNAPIHVGA
jgi:uncharacterized protein YuzE